MSTVVLLLTRDSVLVGSGRCAAGFSGDRRYKLDLKSGSPLHGETGKMAPRNSCQGKPREFGDFAETQRILFTQIVNSLIPKI